MENKIRNPRVVVTTSISSDHWDLAKNKGIAWNDGLEFGIQFLIADKDGGFASDYPRNKLIERVERITKMLNAKSQECEALRDQLIGNEKNLIEDQEIDKVFNARPNQNGKENKQ